MKFLALLLFAGTTMFATADTSRGLQSLADKWNITDPTFSYTSLSFQLDYGVSDFIMEGMQTATIYDEECQTGGVTVGTNVLEPTLEALATTQADGAGRRTVSFDVKVNPETITTDTNIYEELTGPGGELSAVVTFCVRLGLSTTGASPIEVNFHETIVILNVKLTDGFAIDNISVTPRDKLVRTANQVYELEAFQCDQSNTELTPAGQAVVRNQGAVIRVCVRPNADARPDGIKMREIKSLTYTRTTPVATQAAVENGAAASNGLSDLICSAGADVCSIETILTADFYRVTGVVSGSGVGSMQFGSRRRLRSNERALQQDAAGESQFDLSVETNAAVDNTASGASSTGVFALTLLAFSGVLALV